MINIIWFLALMCGVLSAVIDRADTPNAIVGVVACVPIAIGFLLGERYHESESPPVAASILRRLMKHGSALFFPWNYRVFALVGVFAGIVLSLNLFRFSAA